MSLAGTIRPRESGDRWRFARALSALCVNFWTNLRGNEGAEILEFAISLPLLIVVAVGVFDFGTAFTVKQKVGNIALQGARVASNQPTADLSLNGACGAPASICSVRDVVESNMVASKLNDCGLAGVAGAPSGSLSWTFTANAGCGGTLTLKIERGYVYTATLPSPPFQAGNYSIEGTRVTLNYPYRWQFNRVAPLIAPGANYPATTQINSVAIMQNLN
ncbi:MAG: TadE/TadG family type IV pilus assembly protein [Terriglobales bacterium]